MNEAICFDRCKVMMHFFKCNTALRLGHMKAELNKVYFLIVQNIR